MGQSDTENRAEEAVLKALSNPLLDVDIDGADGALVNVVGGGDLTLKESQEVVNAVTSRLSPDAKIIWGAQMQKDLGDSLRVMVIVTGVKSPQIFGSELTVQKEGTKFLIFLYLFKGIPFLYFLVKSLSMPRLNSVKRKFAATLLFSLLASVAGIIHGVFFDMDISQLSRFTAEGFVLTFIVLFPSLLFLEWIFDLEDKEEFKVLESRIGKLERNMVKMSS